MSELYSRREFWLLPEHIIQVGKILKHLEVLSVWICLVPLNVCFETRQECKSSLLDVWCDCLSSIISPGKRMYVFFAELFLLTLCSCCWGRWLNLWFQGWACDPAWSISVFQFLWAQRLVEWRQGILHIGPRRLSVKKYTWTFWRDTLALYQLGFYQRNRTVGWIDR